MTFLTPDQVKLRLTQINYHEDDFAAHEIIALLVELLPDIVAAVRPLDADRQRSGYDQRASFRGATLGSLGRTYAARKLENERVEYAWHSTHACEACTPEQPCEVAKAIQDSVGG